MTVAPQDYMKDVNWPSNSKCWRPLVYSHNWGQHWACTWHGSVRRVTIDEVAHVLQISHGSAYEMMLNKLGFIKSVQDGSQNNSQRCINKRAWTSAKNIWIAMVMNATSSWTESSLVIKHGSIIMSQRVNGRVWNGNIHNRSARKSSKPNHPQ